VVCHTLHGRRLSQKHHEAAVPTGEPLSRAI
jgi:hypothetical protein